ncbi:Nnf2p KNAG_0B01160 [Huiozyma naganishii CBS 8797]|uniref:Uncharacterized protein n=1 Tax=Huiozyma naganishii (strain ATCC MYA-139 / BCRC 22969 / CBS 8797 / KCTC 17520 / NBRC 10181 / NCYC 3082 / Yp74L-3) TaxID=1071383 RepID=J7RGA0_HUIN7|nr:hypothetical protein KNAG_0B01160 [Kazachstania naganishii CBS 8797]CCK68563.1 hypothetical protein KNAG_0B01160 [Kazachstania naganishii CBS 8797]
MTDHQPIHFARTHRFKDTLALLIVFLSFNHFFSLCLLASFVVATRFKNFLAHCFIVLFLSKSPSPCISEATHSRKPLTTNSSNSKLHAKRRTKSLSKSIGSAKDICNYGKLKCSTENSRNFHSLITLLAVEIVGATVIRKYGSDYFVSPIETLAMAIVASFLINDPVECLSYATACTVLYAVSMNISRKVVPMISPLSFHPGTNLERNMRTLCLIWLNVTDTMKTLEYHLFSKYARYIRGIRFYLSFHVVFFQFSKNTFSPNGKKYTLLNPPPKFTFPLLNFGEQKDLKASENDVKDSSGNHYSDSSSPTPKQSAKPSPFTSPSDSSADISGITYSTQPSIAVPYFSKMVRNVKSYSPLVPLPDNDLKSASNTAQPLTMNDTQNVDTLPTSSYLNQLHDLTVDLSQLDKTSKLTTDITVMTNIENFIRDLFRGKSKYLIPPLWSMVVTLKTTNFEKRYVKSTTNNVIPDPTVDSELYSMESNGVTESVFTNSASKSMALIAQSKANDYNQLNLVNTNSNIFNRGENDYKVCIIEIGTHSLTFHIENLFDGELIVLVNGLIWSEVSCALVMEHVGEEYVIVSGLVPSCSYDIQFINRLNHSHDYLIADLIVRTNSIGKGKYKVGAAENESDGFVKMDFGFPSYYHRKFLSPLLTLKHSVLTTNANLSEERAKLKKTKKEISKKLASLRQEIGHFKGKIKQHESNDEKNTSRAENLKVTISQNETAIATLEAQMEVYTKQEMDLEDEYLKRKDCHLKKELDYSKLEETSKQNYDELVEQEAKLRSEYQLLLGKKDKLETRNGKLQKEVLQNNSIVEDFKAEYIPRKDRERTERIERMIMEVNELELNMKALEQDVSRLESGNETMKNAKTSFQT